MRAIPAMGENRSLRTRRAGPTIRLLPFLLAAVAAWDAGAAPTRRLGLILGANDGGNGRARLQYAGDDARTFAQSMLELGGIAFVIHGAWATLRKLRARPASAVAAATAGDGPRNRRP